MVQHHFTVICTPEISDYELFFNSFHLYLFLLKYKLFIDSEVILLCTTNLRLC